MDNTTILITGASSGFGAALAKCYAKNGRHIALCGRDITRLKQIEQSCTERGAAVSLCTIDITDSSAFEAWVRDFDRRHPIDLMIANAGVTGGNDDDGSGERLDISRKIISINLMGMISSVHPVIEGMRKRRQGHIAFVSSIQAFKAFPHSPSYCASKSGINAYAESIRIWLKPQGIRVSVVCPGFIDTPMSQRIESAKPFQLSADKAAYITKKGLDKGQIRIVFPYLLYLGTLFLNWLPRSIVDRILNATPVSIKST